MSPADGARAHRPRAAVFLAGAIVLLAGAGPVPEEVLTAVVRIENREREGLAPGTAVFATGFLVAVDGGRVALVTNKHVLSARPTHLGRKVPRIRLHLNRRDAAGRLVKAPALEVDLERDGRPLYRDHPSDDVDLVAVDVTETLADEAGLVVHPLPLASILTRARIGAAGVDMGSRVLVVGYPFNATTNESNLPLVREGVIASKIGETIPVELPPGAGRLVALRGFYLDATIAGSSSGSPVLVRGRGSGPWSVVGVVQSFAMDESWDLGRAHDAELVRETLALLDRSP